MAVPALRSPGLIVDPNWASSTSHPCHALAGTIKAAIVLASDGTVYDAAGLNTLSGVVVDANGFVATVAQTATLNALKAVYTDYTILVTGAITGLDTGTQYIQNGFKLLAYHYGTGNDYDYQYGGIGGPIYSGGNGTVAMGKAHGGQTFVNLIGSTNSADAASQALKTYTATYRSDGTYSAKTDFIAGALANSTLPSYATNGGVYVSGTYDVPGSTISGITSAVYASTVEWNLGCVPDAAFRPAKEARVRLGVVFSAPATEAMMDYLIAHPDEMLIASVVASPPVVSPPVVSPPPVSPPVVSPPVISPPPPVSPPVSPPVVASSTITPLPALRNPGLVVDPNWASSASHPCHSLAGKVKAAVVLANDGTVYDATGLNTLSSVVVDTNGFAVVIANNAPLNALKAISTDYTLLVIAAITGVDANPSGAFHDNGHKFFSYNYGSDVYQYGGIGGPIYSGSFGVLALGKAGGTQNKALMYNGMGSSDNASLSQRAYVATYRSDGTFSAKTELVKVGATPTSQLPGYASNGATYTSSTYFVPGSAGGDTTLAQYAANITWYIGGVQDPVTLTPLIETRARLGILFSAPVNETMMDYLLAHSDEMLIAGMVMPSPPLPPSPPSPPSPPVPPSPPSPTSPPSSPPVAVSPVSVPGAMETFPFPIDGYPLRNTSGVVVTDATLTIVGVMDCIADGPVKDSAGLAISLTDTTAISLEYALFGGVSLGGCCAMYDVQRYGDAHLCVQPVKAGNTFLPLFVPLRATVSNNDLVNLGQVAIDALNSGSSVLTAAVGAQTAAVRVSSAYVTQGQAVALGADAVSNITNVIPTTTQIVTAIAASPSSGGLTTAQKAELDAIQTGVAANAPALVISAMKADVLLAGLFNHTLGKYSYNIQTHVMTENKDDGTPLVNPLTNLPQTVTLTFDPATGIVTGKG